MILGRRDRERLRNAERERERFANMELRVDLVEITRNDDASVTTTARPVLVSSIELLYFTRIYSNLDESWIDHEAPLAWLADGHAVQIRLDGRRII